MSVGERQGGRTASPIFILPIYIENKTKICYNKIGKKV
jgi:hypothetical protein